MWNRWSLLHRIFCRIKTKKRKPEKWFLGSETILLVSQTALIYTDIFSFFVRKQFQLPPPLSLSLFLSLLRGQCLVINLKKGRIRKKVNTKRDLKRCFLGYGLRGGGLPRLTLCRITFTAGIICQFQKSFLLICICCLIPNSCKSSNTFIWIFVQYLFHFWKN